MPKEVLRKGYFIFVDLLLLITKTKYNLDIKPDWCLSSLNLPHLVATYVDILIPSTKILSNQSWRQILVANCSCIDYSNYDHTCRAQNVDLKLNFSCRVACACRIKNRQNWVFKVNFPCQKLFQCYWKWICSMNIKLGGQFFWDFMKASIFETLFLLKMDFYLSPHKQFI